MSDNENRPGYYVDELEARIAELEKENERLRLANETLVDFIHGVSRNMAACAESFKETDE